MWNEAKYSLLIFDVDYSLCSPKRKITINLADKLLGIESPINHLGGEFVAGKSKDICALIYSCKNIYDKICLNIKKLNKEFGQEALLSIAIMHSNIKFERANKYCMRYWTRTLYLIDTNYMNIPIWHLPAEKDISFTYLYKFITRKNALPSKKRVAKIVHLKRKMNLLELCIYYSKKIYINLRKGNSIKLKVNSGWIDK